MKKWLALAMMLALSMFIVACGGAGGDDDGGGGGGGGGSEELAKTDGFDGKTIKLGVLTPLTGPVAVIGKPLTAGNEVFFEALNKKGGIAGKYPVELVQADTQYLPNKTVQQYNRVKTEVAGFTQVLGTAPTLAVLPQLKTDGIIAAPASLDALWVPEKNLLPIGGPYQVQAINAVDYYVNNEDGKGKNICSMIQDDAYGEAGQSGLEYGAEANGVKVVETQRFKVGDKDVTGQIQSLAKAKCDMVFLVGTPSDAGTIWGTAAKLQFAPRWIGQSPTWIGALASSPLKEYLAQTTLIAAEGTTWGDESVPGMKQLVADQKEFKPDQAPDYYFVFGYNQARAWTALLEKAVEDGDLSREGLMKSLENLGTVSFDGLGGDYEYGAQRNPPRTSTMFKVKPDDPFGLEKLEYNFESDAAKEFDQFEN